MAKKISTILTTVLYASHATYAKIVRESNNFMTKPMGSNKLLKVNLSDLSQMRPVLTLMFGIKFS